MEATQSPKMLTVDFQQTTWNYILEDRTLCDSEYMEISIGIYNQKYASLRTLSHKLL
jgi:hypothetical protein